MAQPLTGVSAAARVATGSAARGERQRELLAIEKWAVCKAFDSVPEVSAMRGHAASTNESLTNEWTEDDLLSQSNAVGPQDTSWTFVWWRGSRFFPVARSGAAWILPGVTMDMSAGDERIME